MEGPAGTCKCKVRNLHFGVKATRLDGCRAGAGAQYAVRTAEIEHRAVL
jgi:hypothetical protein